MVLGIQADSRYDDKRLALFLSDSYIFIQTFRRKIILRTRYECDVPADLIRDNVCFGVVSWGLRG